MTISINKLVLRVQWETDRLMRIILTICNPDDPPKGEGNEYLVIEYHHKLSIHCHEYHHKRRCQGESYEPGKQGGLTDMRGEREEDSVL